MSASSEKTTEIKETIAKNKMAGLQIDYFLTHTFSEI